MIIVMRNDATEKHIQTVIGKLVDQNLDVHRSTGEERTILGAVGSHVVKMKTEEFEQLPGVEEVLRITKPEDRADEERG
jgi:hypothetical protein